MKKALETILVIGSGPIVIGQAAEFDYAGTQACRALREKGYRVVLVNSNPATVMTDQEIADTVYIEPLNLHTLTRIIEKESPDGIIGTIGGQMGLNLLVELEEHGILQQYNLQVLGTETAKIAEAEDREKFRQLMVRIAEPVLTSFTVASVEEATEAAERIGFPVIVRPAYTLGGSGGGTADTVQELTEIAQKGLALSPVGQVLIERSIKGWKEIEYEVIRDHADNCITVCNMENVDPVGIHTGDSIVVAPSQTLTDQEYQMLRRSAIAIVRALEICGACNVQFALDPDSRQYYVIEVNPRVSRSSALASKATGYPIAKVAALIAVGMNLDEIMNPITGKTTACFEPTLDYVVCKVPRWPFDKFSMAKRHLGTQMKATGEVMAIGRNFASALMKAVRSLDAGFIGLFSRVVHGLDDTQLIRGLQYADDERLFVVAEGIRRGWGIERLHELTRIDPFFLAQIAELVQLEKQLRQQELSAELLKEAKMAGFTDHEIGVLATRRTEEVRALRKGLGLNPVYKMVDTCAGEFSAATPYFYSTYELENEAIPTGERKVLVIGSGPIRIGQGIEFDYCSVHAVLALRKAGYTAVVVNNNPETVSTDFDISDRLYFEPLTPEDVMEIAELEQPEGVIIQFGGQTALDLAETFYAQGVPVLGTAIEDLQVCEDREKFYQKMPELGISVPGGRAAHSAAQAWEILATTGYPVLVRPSYVLGGRAMEIIDGPERLREYIQRYEFRAGQPLLIDRYLLGMEVEVDAISDGEDVLIPGIMEHVERAGVHSGDSVSVFPSQRLSAAQKARIEQITMEAGKGLGIKGIFNIQFIVTPADEVYMLEVNPRSSRTVPFISKVTGVPLVQLATEVIMGAKLKELGYGVGLLPEPAITAVKAPVFSFAKLDGLDPVLGPEMKSTGEVMGLGKTMSVALLKAFEGTGRFKPREKAVLITAADIDKAMIGELAKRLIATGFRIYATEGTGAYLAAQGITNQVVAKIGRGKPDIIELIRQKQVDYIFNSPSPNQILGEITDGYQIRRKAVEFNIPIITNVDTMNAFVAALEQVTESGWDLEPISLGSIERRKLNGKHHDMSGGEQATA